MNKINEIIGEIALIKKRKRITDIELSEKLNMSKYSIVEALKGTGKINVLGKIYEYCKEK